MKVLTAYTTEIDDVDEAVDEILSQLRPEENLCANSAGIVTCHAEYIDNGIIAALGERLPFPIVGCTTISSSVAGETGFDVLGIMVLTGDDVSFSTAFSDSLYDELHAPLDSAYRQARQALDGEPALAIVFAPLINHVGGELIVETLNEVSQGEVPMFGTLALDHNTDYSEAQTIHGGETSHTRLSLLLISGNIKPRFFVSSVSNESTQKHKAIVTKSEGNILIEVNGLPVLKYLETLGLVAEDGSINGVNTIPVVFDYGDGTEPVTCAVYKITDEGSIVCGGRVPVDSTFALASLSSTDVITAAGETAEKLSGQEAAAILMFPCLARCLVLGTDALAELDIVCRGISGRLPYMMSYSGGEVCPVGRLGGGTVNRFHNFSLVGCII